MTELQMLEKDIETCNQLIKEAAELDKALGSKHGKLILKLLEDGQKAAAELTTNVDDKLRHQGLLGVQAVVWVNQHLEYQQQLARHAEAQLKALEDEKQNLLADVE